MLREAEDARLPVATWASPGGKRLGEEKGPFSSCAHPCLSPAALWDLRVDPCGCYCRLLPAAAGMGDVRVPQLLPHLPDAPDKLFLRLPQEQRELESAGQFVPRCHSHSVHERCCPASQRDHQIRNQPPLAPLLPAQQRSVVLCLRHNLPVHPPCFQHLLPVTPVVPDWPLQKERDGALLHQRPQPGPLTSPRGRAVALSLH